MNVLVVGDIHNKLEPITNFLKNWNGKVIFTGDYFDDFGDDPYIAMRTAHWLKSNLDNPNYIFLMGNHDFHYMTLPYLFSCSGFNEHKHEYINKIIKKEDWNKLKFFHHEEEYWFSHAGISSQWFSHPIIDINVEVINKTIESCLPFIRTGPFEKIAPLWASDFLRGGAYKTGGILWNDWNNRQFFPNVTQIMGHTPQKHILVMEDEEINSKCINIDAYKSANEILHIYENELNILTLNG